MKGLFFGSEGTLTVPCTYTYLVLHSLVIVTVDSSRLLTYYTVSTPFARIFDTRPVWTQTTSTPH